MGLQAPHSNPQGQVEEQEGWPRDTWTEVEGRCPFQSDLVTARRGGRIGPATEAASFAPGGGVLHLCATTAFFIVNCGLPFHFSCNGHPTGILNVSSFTVKVLQYCWVGWYRIKDGPRPSRHSRRRRRRQQRRRRRRTARPLAGSASGGRPSCAGRAPRAPVATQGRDPHPRPGAPSHCGVVYWRAPPNGRHPSAGGGATSPSGRPVVAFSGRKPGACSFFTPARADLLDVTSVPPEISSAQIITLFRQP